jgi:hypothetical protein
LILIYYFVAVLFDEFNTKRFEGADGCLYAINGLPPAKCDPGLQSLVAILAGRF